jgi:hypothetical protein
MLLPNDVILNLWWTAAPIYEWEPVPPAEGATGSAVTSDAAAPPAATDADCATPNTTTAGLPVMRLVFKGMRWSAVPVWTMRENPAWEQIAQDRRDEDEKHSRARRRLSQQPPAPDGSASAQGTAGTANTSDE